MKGLQKWKKDLNEKELKDVNAGLAFAEFKQELLAKLPVEVKRKLALAKSDNEACKILADSGIDYEAIEARMKNIFARNGKNLLALNDRQLEAISGGFDTDSYGEFVCRNCKATESDDFSYQFWASTFLTSGRIYRCKKCGTYILKTTKNSSTFMDEAVYDEWLDEVLQLL